MIICIGYSFSDDHINGLISQALKQNSNSKLLVVKYSNDKNNDIIEALNVNESQIEVRKSSAKEYFENELTTEKLLTLFPIEDEDQEIL